MRKRIYFFLRTSWDLIPALWYATKHTNFDVGVFHCNDKESWSKYMEIKEKIAQIIEPTYTLSERKGYIKTILKGGE